MGVRDGWDGLGEVIHGILRLSFRDKLTTVHALAVMSVVELTVRWVPLPRLSRAMGVPLRLGTGPADPDSSAYEALDPVARRQIDCTARVAALWPFSDGPCLRRSLTGGHLIRRVHPVLRLGLLDHADGLGAHAWLEIDGLPMEQVSHIQPFPDLPLRGLA